jgi:tetratricopeptide (TPR) repeat protein
MQKEQKRKTLREIFMENELPLSGKSELDLKYEKAIEIILNADAIEETAFDIDDKNERNRVFDKIKNDWAIAYSIFEELSKVDHAESLYKLGLCCCYGIAQKDGKSRYSKAAEYFRKAASLGHNGAKEMLEEIEENAKHDK